MRHWHVRRSHYSRGSPRDPKGQRRIKVRFFPVAALSPARPEPLLLFETKSIRFLCRYAASKDRRALDPPPVLDLRIYDVRDNGDGTAHETEVDYR